MTEIVKAYLIKADTEVVSVKDLVKKSFVFVKLLYKRRYFIIIASFSGACIGIILSLSQKPNYKANISYIVQQQSSQGGIGNYSGIASQLGVNLGSADKEEGLFSVNNLKDFLLSRSVLQTALESHITLANRQLTFAEYYLEINKVTHKNLDNKLNPYEILESNKTNSRQRDSIMGVLCDLIRANNIKEEKGASESDILNLSCISPDERFSREFLIKLLAVVSTEYINTKTLKLKSNIALMRGRSDSTKTILNRLVESKAYSTDQNLNSFKATVNVPIQRKELQIQILQAQYIELEKNINLLQFQLLQQTPLIKIVDPPFYPLEKLKLGKTKGAILGFFFVFFSLILIYVIIFYIGDIFKNENLITSQ